MLANELEVVTYGLDDIVIENSKDEQLEVVLLDENPHTHNILFKKEGKVFTITFELNIPALKNEVFRKYITRRLERARAVIKVPKNKHISIHGRTIGVTSKSYKGDVNIYIERGNIKLNTIKGNSSIDLFQGNVFANIDKQTSLGLKTNNGTILINGERKISLFSKEITFTSKILTINSIHANLNIGLE
ncbi:DUF4097 family beta strand repeat-containing protein [Tenacibaculum sp. 1_MG-2023]|uniref:DUF4097 family beta strand repeat-containing protein n=1 Tax=Tenacibaculum sp. 1_MG-2023 TaxID=3062653 RepID=UPI0026E2EE42|nr:DUF4097 family beta strand repeat-containing protein [Tenacibaculum sp. 1_MG-2023]MDO6676574.1 DUF4097 family beta strand repeat-containing protein [Tenacibaculum sp. 1_MG-2023]